MQFIILTNLGLGKSNKFTNRIHYKIVLMPQEATVA